MRGLRRNKHDFIVHLVYTQYIYGNNVLGVNLSNKRVVQYLFIPIDRAEFEREWLYWHLLLFSILDNGFVHFTIHYRTLYFFSAVVYNIDGGRFFYREEEEVI